ncbi:MAG TPA: PilZ domain-containing protein [Pyrinomonadaceae bacterium]|nr:PilZ domain-containing protein [Pyrinomonadaceae bacterium]
MSSKVLVPEPSQAAPFALRAVVRWNDGREPREEVSGLSNVTPQGATLLLGEAPEPGYLLCLQLPGARGNPLGMKMYALVWAVAGAPDAGALGPAGQQHSVSVIFVDDAPGGKLAEEFSTYTYLIEEDGRVRLQRQQANARREPNQRRESRIGVPVEMMLEALRPDGSVLMCEQTVTENISRSGAAILTSLLIGARQPVRLTSARYGIAMPAVVRARSIGPDGIARLHVEFDGNQFPLEKIV